MASAACSEGALTAAVWSANGTISAASAGGHDASRRRARAQRSLVNRDRGRTGGPAIAVTGVGNQHAPRQVAAGAQLKVVARDALQRPGFHVFTPHLAPKAVANLSLKLIIAD